MVIPLLYMLLRSHFGNSLNCYQYKESSSIGVTVAYECGNLKPFDCCARCMSRNHSTGCVSTDWSTNGCCTYFSTFTGTKPNASSTALTVAWPVAPTPGPITGSFCEQPGWKTVWEDEFTGNSLNTTNWNYMLGHDDGTLRGAIGTKDNVMVKDGNLVLRAQIKGYDSDRPKNCSVFMKETDLTGGQGVATTSAKDSNECCSQCSQNPVCQYFTYLPGAYGCDVGCCYQKNNVSGTKYNNATTSGFCPGGGTYTSGAIISAGLNNPSAVGTANNAWMHGRFCVRAKLPGIQINNKRPSNCSTIMQDTDVLGGDIGTLSAKDVGQCCDQCYQNALCSYFVYLKGGWGCDVGCCYMKSSDAVAFNTSATGCKAGFNPGGNVKNQGIWPAHWLMPNVKDCWPTQGEIDIMEMINGEGILWGSYHYSGNGQCGADAAVSRSTRKVFTDWSSQYHEYAVEWDQTHMYWVVDGVTYSQMHPGDPPTYGGPNKVSLYEDKYYWLLNTAIGKSGTWSGPPSLNTIFPNYHYIDYVKVAQSTT